MRKLFFLLLVIAFVMFIPKVNALTTAQQLQIEAYSTRIDNVKVEVQTGLNNFNAWSNTYANDLKAVLDSSLDATLISDLNVRNYGNVINTIINALNTKGYTSAGSALLAIKPSLLLAINDSKALKDEIKSFLQNNKSDLDTTSLFPMINSLDLAYNSIYSSLRTCVNTYKNMYETDLSTRFTRYESLNSNDLYNELLPLYNRVALYETYLNILQSDLRDWKVLANDLNFMSLGLYDTIEDDIKPLISEYKTKLNNHYNRFLTNEWNRIRNEGMAIHNDASKSISARNALLDNKIATVDATKAKVQSKINVVKAKVTITKARDYIIEFETKIMNELNDVKAYLEGLKLVENYDLVHQAGVTDATIKIDRTAKLLITHKTYNKAGILALIKLNVAGTGVIDTTSLYNNKLVTGSKVLVKNGGSTLITYTIVLKGDVFGKDYINVNNARRINGHILGELLTGIYKEAADLTLDGKINVNDTRYLNKLILEGGI